MNEIVRVRGTNEAGEIAAVLAALAARPRDTPESSGYERWRRTRTAALRVSRAR
jgi:hypothetical protein